MQQPRLVHFCHHIERKNGIVERKHKHILGTARALLFHSHAPKSFWYFAIAHVVHLINRQPSQLLNNFSPYQLMFESVPEIDHLRLFRCLAYVSTLEAHRTKLDPRARKCIFLGYKHGTKYFLLYDLQSRGIFVSRNVYFMNISFLTYTLTLQSLSLIHHHSFCFL